jgi:hypothetical protein
LLIVGASPSGIASMPRKASKFTKSEIARAIKAAQSIGLDIAGFEVAPDGTIKVTAGRPSITHNEWDDEHEPASA